MSGNFGLKQFGSLEEEKEYDNVSITQVCPSVNTDLKVQLLWFPSPLGSEDSANYMIYPFDHRKRHTILAWITLMPRTLGHGDWLRNDLMSGCAGFFSRFHG